MRILIDAPKRLFRSNSTDHQYVTRTLPQLSNEFTHLDFLVASPLINDVKANFDRVARRWVRGLTKFDELTWEHRPKRSFVESQNPAVVYSNSDFPRALRVPVIWQNTLIDPQMRASNGVSLEDIRYESVTKRRLFGEAAAIFVSTMAEMDRITAEFSELRGKVHGVPFYRPTLASLTPDEVRRKQQNGERIDILFVGNDAKRKRLQIVTEAMSKLPADVRALVRLTVVSRFTDGLVHIEVPGVEVTVHARGLSHSAVVNLMKSAHILINPAQYETYGFVFVEAQASGAVCMGPSWEAQRELFQDGHSGFLLPHEVDAHFLAETFEELIKSSERRTNLALNALETFESQLSHRVVGKRIATILDSM